MYYNVRFKRTLNEVLGGTVKPVMIIPMIGRIYKPDRDERGFYTDNVGEKDNRVMVMGAFDYLNQIMDEFYCVLKDADEVSACFEEVPWSQPDL